MSCRIRRRLLMSLKVWRLRWNRRRKKQRINWRMNWGKRKKVLDTESLCTKLRLGLLWGRLESWRLPSKKYRKSTRWKWSSLKGTSLRPTHNWRDSIIPVPVRTPNWRKNSSVPCVWRWCFLPRRSSSVPTATWSVSAVRTTLRSDPAPAVGSVSSPHSSPETSRWSDWSGIRWRTQSERRQ